MLKKKRLTLSDKELIFLSWPIFIEYFLRVVIGNVNVWMIGRYSELAVASVGAANQLLNLSVFIYGFITVGGQIVISQLIGANKRNEIKNVINTAVWGAIGIGIIISLLFLFFSGQMLQLLNLDAELIEIGKPYLKIYGGSLLISAVTAIIIAILRTHSFTQPALLVPLFASILAVIGNYFVLYQPFGIPSFGVAGLAWASVFGNSVGLIIAIYLLKKYIHFSFFSIRLNQISIPYLKSILTLGLPSSGEMFSYQGAQVVVTMIVASLGANVLIAKSYISAITQFVYLMTSSMGQGNQIMIGRHVGAKEFDKAYQRGIRTTVIGIFLSVTICIFTYIFIEQIMSIFTTNPEVIKIAKEVFLVEIVLEAARAVNMILVGSLNASGDVKYPLFCSILVLWVISLPFSYTLAIWVNLGLVGVWIAYALDETLRSFLMLHRWRSGVWKSKGIQASPSEESLA